MLIRLLVPLDDSLDQVLIKDGDMVLGALHIDAFQDLDNPSIYQQLFRGESVTVCIMEATSEVLRNR